MIRGHPKRHKVMQTTCDDPGTRMCCYRSKRSQTGRDRDPEHLINCPTRHYEQTSNKELPVFLFFFHKSDRGFCHVLCRENWLHSWSPSSRSGGPPSNFLPERRSVPLQLTFTPGLKQFGVFCIFTVCRCCLIFMDWTFSTSSKIQEWETQTKLERNNVLKILQSVSVVLVYHTCSQPAHGKNGLVGSFFLQVLNRNEKKTNF